jgi:hypothetical protein
MAACGPGLTACGAGTGCTMTLYPHIVETVVAVLVFSGALGAGVGLVVTALIGGEDAGQGRPATAAGAANSQATRPAERRTLGFLREG